MYKTILFFFWLCAALCAAPISVNTTELFGGVALDNRLYLSSLAGVTVLDTTTKQIITHIPLVGYAGYLNVVGDKICALSQNENTVTVINGITNSKLATISLQAGAGPYYGANYGHKVFVTNYSQSSISVINLDLIPPGTNPETPITAPVESVIELGDTPAYPLIMGDKLFVTHLSNSRISVINANTNSKIATLSKSSSSGMFLGTSLGDKIYNLRIGTQSVIVTNTKLIDYNLNPNTLQTAPLSSIYLSAESSIKTIGENYIVSCNWTVSPTIASIYNVKTGLNSTSILAGDYCFIAAVFGSKVYITTTGGNKIFILDSKNIALNTPILVSTLTGEGSPYQAIIIRDLIYFPNRGSYGTVSVLNAETDTFIDNNPLFPKLKNFTK